jgi:hypothetical protein
MPKPSKRSSSTDTTAPSISPNNRLKKLSRVDLNDPNRTSTTPHSNENNIDDPPPVKTVLTLFNNDHNWYALHHDDTNPMIVVGNPILIPSPLALRRWGTIKSIKKADPFLPEELIFTHETYETIQSDIITVLNRLKLSHTHFYPTLITWLTDNLASHHFKKHIYTYRLANRFARTPPEAIPEYEEIDGCMFFCPNVFSQFWIAAVVVFGPVYVPTPHPNAICSKSEVPMPATPIGMLLANYNFEHGDSSPATTEEDLRSDSGTSLHDLLSSSTAKEVLSHHATWTLAYSNLAELDGKTPEL